ncbi:hypothetical protein SAMN03097699_1898 [Flavobacteriaceae bacterium MAR_2010_188]|nr:hypothetical protein SAMN03097699_1898 [Flavobacteriaceae bacterium MAR_2010_188]
MPKTNPSEFMKLIPKILFLSFLLLLMNACSGAKQESADLVITNALILTIDEASPRAEAIAIKGETILAIGTNEEIQAYINSEATEVIDAKGRLLTPGFNDSHVHLDGIDPDYVDLRYITDQAEIARRVKKQIAITEKGELVLGGNWEHEMFKDRQWPTKETLDSVSPEHPVILYRADGHSVLANSLAMKLAGITDATPNPFGGTIMRDAKGKATGIFQEKARGLITYTVKANESSDKSSETAKMEQWRAAFKHVASLGITSVRRVCASLDSVAVDPSIYQKFKELGELTYRVTFSGKFPASDATLQEYSDLAKAYPPENDWIRFGPIKGHIDGTLGSGTMMVFEPFKDAPDIGLGLEQMPYDAFEERIVAADKMNMQLTIHAIGPRGNDWVLNAYQKARDVNGKRDARHTIEHAQILRKEDIDRFNALNVVASMQPLHVVTDKRFAEKRIGMENLQYSYAWNSLNASGAHISFGSDYPVEPLNPLFGLYAAITRKDLKGESGEGWVPKEKITLEKAIEFYTLGSSYGEFMEDRKGKLKKGYLADMVLFDRNLLSVQPAELLESKVTYTIVGGKIVFKDEI